METNVDTPQIVTAKIDSVQIFNLEDLMNYAPLIQIIVFLMG